LRVYVGAAAAAYGDYRHADLSKIHIGSGKLSLMRFDDFDGKPLPRMRERVKIKLREQDVDYSPTARAPNSSRPSSSVGSIFTARTGRYTSAMARSRAGRS
jgi:hypothetical protein